MKFSSFILCAALFLIIIFDGLAMGNPDEAETSSNGSSSDGTSNVESLTSAEKSELAANLYALLNLRTQIQMDYMANDGGTTMSMVNAFNTKYAKFVNELPNDLLAKSKLEKNLHKKIDGKLEQIQFKNELGIIQENLLFLLNFEQKMQQTIEHIEYSQNVYEIVQYHLERVPSELYRRKHYKYKLLLLSKWNLPIEPHKLVNVFDIIQNINMLSGYLYEVVLHQETRATMAKMIDQMKNIEQSLAQKLEIDQKLLRQMQKFDQMVPNAWECQDEMQMMARLDNSMLSHGQISLIYMHACAVRLASELGTLIEHLEEIGAEWTNTDAVDEVLKSAFVLEQHRQAVLKL